MQGKPRSRIQNSMTPTGGLSYSVWNEPGHTPSGGGVIGTGQYYGTFRSIDDFVLPGYKKFIQKGAIVNQPCTRKFSQVSLMRSTVTSHSNSVNNSTYLTTEWRQDPLSYLIGGIIQGGNNSAFTDLSSTYVVPGMVSGEILCNRALISALKKVNPPEMQSIVTLAELNKTISLIGDTAKHLADALKAIKAGRPDKAIQAAFGRPSARPTYHPKKYTRWTEGGEPVVSSRSGKPSVIYGHSPRATDLSSVSISDVNQKWLEYRYGWGPMVMDIVSALKALNKVRENRRFVVRGSSESAESFSETILQGSSDGGKATKRHDVSHSRTARAYVLYEVDLALARANDFGVWDFPSSAWELLPYSFVIDWFVPIGDWIQAITPKIGVNILASGYTLRDAKEVKRTLTGWTPDSTGAGGWSEPRVPIGSSDSANHLIYSRIVDPTVPSFPKANVQMNVNRALDSIALLSGLRSRNLRI